jgi:hypothetical protein
LLAQIELSGKVQFMRLRRRMPMHFSITRASERRCHNLCAIKICMISFAIALTYNMKGGCAEEGGGVVTAAQKDSLALLHQGLKRVSGWRHFMHLDRFIPGAKSFPPPAGRALHARTRRGDGVKKSPPPPPSLLYTEDAEQSQPVIYMRES